VEVTIGRRRVGSVEILAGVAEGDLVVIEGTMELRPGSKAQILNKDKIEGPPSADAQPAVAAPARGPS
jgi:hypothetical protein